jgi:lysophospholipase L1-like esterase
VSTAAVHGGIVHAPRAGWTYPRLTARAEDALPADTREAARVPAGLRVEAMASAAAIAVDYVVGPAAPLHEWANDEFALWVGEELVATHAVAPGSGRVVVGLPAGNDVAVEIFPPAHMDPVVRGVQAIEGALLAPPARPRWLAYGDSITAGWSAPVPGSDWVSRAARDVGLDAVNLGFAGAARGEPAVADDIADLAADVITVAFGTNCWKHVPHTAEHLEDVVVEFLRRIARGHPQTPVIVLTPISRPDADDVAGPVGATLEDLRGGIRRAVARVPAANVRLVEGRELVPESELSDGIHPDGRGHRRMAEELSAVLADALGGRARATVAAEPTSEGDDDGHH